MKFLKLAVVTAISLGAFTGLAQVSAATDGMDGRSKVYSPNVDKVKRADVAGFVIAARGQLTATNEAGDVRTLDRRSKFYANETLKTGEASMAQLRFKDRALMTLKPESQLDIGEYHFGGAKDPENKSFLSLVSGGFRTISGAIGRANESAYRIETPAASIGIRGTDYELIISLDGKVFAAVHDGGISIVNDIGELDLGEDSDYLFAEVGEGQSPLGLSEMPEVFQVKNGEKTALSPEQKAKLAKKLAEGKEKAEALFASFEEGDQVEDRGDLKELLAEEALKRDSSAETRLPASLLEKIKNEGDFAVNTSSKGSMVYGRSLTDDKETIFLTKDDDLLAPELKPLTKDGELISTGHPNVSWGRWDTGFSLGDNGVRNLIPVDEDQFFMSARLLDVAKIQAATDSVELNLASLIGQTTEPDFAKIDAYSGTVNLDFDDKLVSGSISMDVAFTPPSGENTSGPVDINFDGPMLNGNQLNHQFNSSATINESVNLGNENVNVVGAVVEPSDSQDLSTSAFAGGFEASLPSEVTDGVKVGVSGLFVFSNAQVHKMKPAPFL